MGNSHRVFVRSFHDTQSDSVPPHYWKMDDSADTIISGKDGDCTTNWRTLSLSLSTVSISNSQMRSPSPFIRTQSLSSSSNRVIIILLSSFFFFFNFHSFDLWTQKTHSKNQYKKYQQSLDAQKLKKQKKIVDTSSVVILYDNDNIIFFF